MNSVENIKPTIHLETILLFNVDQIMKIYEQKMFQSISQKNKQLSEDHLTNFCMKLLDLTDEEQVFIARIFFTGLVTDVMKMHARKNQLHPKQLSNMFKLISEIETFENISEFILFIPPFIKFIFKQIIGNHLLIEGNQHVENILRLIDDHLASNYLSVKWIAKQLNLSTTHISNTFKQHMDESITKYITRRKINEIAYEIQHSNQSIQKIRQKYGFVNQSHFIQRFKSIKGVTPLQFKKQLYFKG